VQHAQLLLFSAGCGIKKQSPKKELNFSKTTRYILLYFLMFSAEVITYHIYEFHRNILSKNKTMAARIQKCISLSEQQLK